MRRLLPARWPAVLVVDSKAFVRGRYHQAKRFNVLAASGIEEIPKPGKHHYPKAWTMQPFPRKDFAAWKAFFNSLEGTPRIVVSDADPTILKAMDAVFPRLGDPFPEHRISEHHIKRAIEEYMPVGLLNGPDPIGRTYGMALTSLERWEAFVRACEEETVRGRYPMTRLMKWLQRYGARVAAQAATRRPELPNSTGPVEAVLRELGVRIESRTGGFTNRARMTKLLMLICADLRKRSDGRVWADLLRERIYLAGGHPRPQRPHDDRRGVHSLLA